MEVPLKFDLCVICVERIPDSLEHLVQRSIGGLAEVRMMCKECNGRLGHDLDPELKQDPQIRFAIEHLRDELPDLHQKYNEGLEFTAEGSSGDNIRLKMKKGKHSVREYKQEDGTIIATIPNTVKAIEQTLKRRGKVEEIETATWRFLEAPHDELVQIAQGFAVAKRTAQNIDLKLTGDLMSDRLRLKFGYVHLAFLLNMEFITMIREYPGYFLPIIDAINGNANIPPHVEITSGMTRNYKVAPNHIVRYVADERSLTVEAQLFGVLRFGIKFLGFTPGPVDLPVWIHDMANRNLLMARSIEDFKNRKLWERGKGCASEYQRKTTRD